MFVNIKFKNETKNIDSPVYPVLLLIKFQDISKNFILKYKQLFALFILLYNLKKIKFYIQNRQKNETTTTCVLNIVSSVILKMFDKNLRLCCQFKVEF